MMCERERRTDENLDADLEAVQVSLVQPAALHGEVKSLAALTLENIADTVVREGLTSRAEIVHLVRDLTEFGEDPRTLMTLPRIFQVRGRRTR